jgi:hypothetical protein
MIKIGPKFIPISRLGLASQGRVRAALIRCQLSVRRLPFLEDFFLQYLELSLRDLDVVVCFRRLILRIVGAEVTTASPWPLDCKINRELRKRCILDWFPGSAGLTYIRDDPRNVTWAATRFLGSLVEK